MLLSSYLTVFIFWFTLYATLAELRLQKFSSDYVGELWGLPQSEMLEHSLHDLQLAPGVLTACAGEQHTCSLSQYFKVLCWGGNSHGQLGLGDTLPRGAPHGEPPRVELPPGRAAVSLTCGAQHTCAVLDSGELVCWGRGADGRLGTGAEEDVGDSPGEMGAALAPVDLGPGSRAVAAAAGERFTCALLASGAVKCFGFNGEGQLGRGSASSQGGAPGELGAALPPVGLGAGGRAAVSVHAGGRHACAVLDDGSLVCWGSNSRGQLGAPASSADPRWGSDGDGLALVDLGPGARAIGVTAGPDYTCVALTSGGTRCFGDIPVSADSRSSPCRLADGECEASDADSDNWAGSWDDAEGLRSARRSLQQADPPPPSPPPPSPPTLPRRRPLRPPHCHPTHLFLRTSSAAPSAAPFPMSSGSSVSSSNATGSGHRLQASTWPRAAPD
uniref:Rcc1 repeat-containing protein n=1 Tax=Tetraselmis sp. GSL018 TaxID=582737 RepID=A0A061QKX5_9CHLO